MKEKLLHVVIAKSLSGEFGPCCCGIKFTPKNLSLSDICMN